MKTSTKLMISAFTVLIISMGIYNSALKAEYVIGNYKNPYKEYKTIALKDFTEVEINGAKMIDVEFKQGPFAVYQFKYTNDTVSFGKFGNKLIVNINLPKQIELHKDNNEEQMDAYNHDNRIIIVCPNLKALTSTNVYLVNGKKLTGFDYDKNSKYSHKTISINKFNVDSLLLNLNGNSQVDLSESKITNLITNANNFSSFKIEEETVIESASLQIKSKAELWLNNVSFSKLSYQISDSARVTLYGKSINNFIKK